jgi:inner membrane protein
MEGPMLSWIGWVATALFASSYFCKRQVTLRRVQAAAAVLWVIYGLLIHAFPVVVANALVAMVALYSSFRGRLEPALTASPSRTP